MIGILRPQSPPNEKGEGVWLARGTLGKGLGKASRRYVAEHEGLGARHPRGPQLDGSPAPLPVVLDGDDGTADDHPPPQKPRGFAVAVLRSACDGHKINLLQSAEVGAVCVAVACQTSKQASRAIWSAGSRKATEGADHNQRRGRASSEGPGSFRALLGRLRGFRREAQHAACLVLYCKFPGAIMASPLDGPVFRLRREVGKEDASERETTDKMCWSLPEGGFNALRDVEASIVPGLSALARDVANDSSCLKDSCLSAELLSLRLCSNEGRQYVVVPRVAGIFIVQIGASVRSGHGKASSQATAIVATLEKEGDTCGQGFALQMHGVKCTEGGAVLFPEGGGSSSRRRRRRRKRHISLPVTYAALLDEARSRPGRNSTARSIWNWRRERQYSAGPSQVVPGAGEHPGVEEESPLGTPLPARAEEGAITNPAQNETENAMTCGSSGKLHRSDVLTATATTCGSSGGLHRSDVLAVPPQLLTAVGVQSASASQLVVWAKTRNLVQALLVAACQRTEVRPNQAEKEHGAWASCAEARLVACALLSAVFGIGEDGIIGRASGMLDKGETSLLLDRWFEDFCSAAACFGEGQSPRLKEIPRLLLEGMLSVPAVRSGFVQRGLVRRLTEGLRLSLRRYHGRSSLSLPGVFFCSSVKLPQLADVKNCLNEDDPRTDAGRYTTMANCLCAKIQYPDPSTSQATRLEDIPWWLLQLGRRVEHNPAGDTHGGDSSARGGTRASAEVDESSKLASEEGFTSGEEDHNISQITQEDDPTVDGGGNRDHLAFTVSAPPSPTGEHVPDRRREGGGREGGEGAGGSSSRERITPPRLRLDALDSILNRKEGASPRFCSPHAAVTLSAASTRASAHLQTFRSARGATSRGSARHGSGRSTRTGRNTQQDPGSAGCPTGRSVTACVPAGQDAAAAAAAAARLSLPTSPVSLVSARNSACLDGDGDGERNVRKSPPSAKEGGRVTHEIDGGGDAGVMADVGGGGVPSDATTINPGLPGGGRRSPRVEMPRLQLAELPVNVTTQTQGELVVAGGSHRARITLHRPDAYEKLSNRELGTSLLEPDASYCGSEAGKFEGGAPNGNLLELVSATAAADAKSSAHTTNRGLDTSTTDINRLEGKDSPHDDGSDKSSVMEPNETVAQRIDPVVERGVKHSERFCGNQTSSSASTIEEPRSRRAINFSRLIVDHSSATNFLFRLAYASVPPNTLSSQQPSKPTTVDDFASEVAVAKHLVSLLPLCPIERDGKEALVVALDVLSLAGTLSWVDLAFRTALTSNREAAYAAKENYGVVDDDNPRQRWSSVWPQELDTVDIALFASVAETYLDARWSVLRSQFQGTRETYVYQDIGSSCHRDCVHKACHLALGCTWVTRFLFRRILSAGALDGQFRSSLPAETVTSLIKCCGRALEALLGDISLVASGRCAKTGDVGFQQTPALVEGKENRVDDELLLLATSAAVGVVSSLTALLNQQAAWGEDLGWATTTLASTDFCFSKGAVIPVLVQLFKRLVASVLAGGHFEPAELEGGPPSSACASPHARSGSPNRLTGAEDALGELLVTVIRTLDAVLRRTATLIEACRDLPPPQTRRRHSEAALCVAAAVGRKREDDDAASDRDCRVPENTVCTTVSPASDDMEALAKEDKPSNDREAVVHILRAISPVFSREGPVLAILNAQSVAPQPSGRGGGKSASSIPSDEGIPVRGLSAPCLAATLHLSAMFFSVWVKYRDAVHDEKVDTRLEDFVGPIFSGFHLRSNGGGGGGFQPNAGSCVRSGGQEREDEGRVRPGLKHGEGNSLCRDKEEELLLCRLHLEALVELSLTGDPAVQKKLRERRVAQVLGDRFFGDDSATNESEVLTDLSTSILRPVGSSSDGKVVAPPPSSRAVDAEPEKDSDPVRNLAGVPDAVATSVKMPGDVPTDETKAGIASTNGNHKIQHTLAETTASLPPVVSTRGTPSRDNLEPGMLGGGELEQSIQPKVVTGRAVSFSAGDRVSGLFAVKSGRRRWFTGRVKRVNEDGTLHVCYDDGDEEMNKKCVEVRPHRRIAERMTRSCHAVRVRDDRAAGTATLAPTLCRGSDSEGEGQTTQTAGSLTPQYVKPGAPVAEGLALQDGERRQCSVGATGRDRLAVTPLAEIDFATSDGSTAAASGGLRQTQGQVLLPAVGTEAVFAPRDPGVVAPIVDDVEAARDSEEEDMCFVIPSVLDGMSAARSARRSDVAQVSVIPRIDLQSQMFRTRVHSAQLGPGSSLSTPTTGGGGRGILVGAGGGGLRSEQSVAAMFVGETSTRPQSSSSLAVPSTTVAVLPSQRGSSVAASVAVQVSPRLRPAVCKFPAASATEGVFRGIAENPPSQELVLSCTHRGSGASCFSARYPPSENTRGEYLTAAVAVTHPVKEPIEGGAVGSDSFSSGRPSGITHGGAQHDASPTAPRPGTGGVCAMRGCAVSLLLSMASTLDSSDVSTEPGSTTFDLTTTDHWGKEDLLPKVMALLQVYFENPRNAHTVTSLRTRWREGVSMAEVAPAVLAKLVCAALFDARSYALDGRHIAAGKSGGVIVSRCPLPLGDAGHPTRKSPTELASVGKREKTQKNSSGTPPLSRSSYQCGEDEVALKVVEKDDLDRMLGPAVFVEVLALRALCDVPGVCRLYDFGVTLDSYVLVMERCLFSLKDWRVARGGGGGSGDDDNGGEAATGAPRSDEEAALYLLVFRQIASAVAAMADRGVIHFDLKCDNVLVRGGRHNVSSAVIFGMGGIEDVPSVCVADFGESVIGQQRQGASGPKSDASCKGLASSENGRFEFDVRNARGTERIQSPEMIIMARNNGGVGNAGGRPLPTSDLASNSSQGNRPMATRITTASDIWSLGCLLYELLSSQPLFQDLRWSEFFVMLTSGEAAGVGRVAGAAGERLPKPLLPPPGTLPFAALRSAEALRTLLESMLVRNPNDRPSAFQTVENIDKTLVTIVPECAKTSAGAAVKTLLPMSTDNCFVDNLSSENKQAFSTQTPQGCAARSEERSLGGGADSRKIVSKATQDSSRARAAGRGAILSELPTAEADTWPLQPCMATLLHRSLAVRQSTLLGCAGLLYRLGEGAFLLEVNDQIDLGADTGGGNNRSIGSTLRNKTVHAESVPRGTSVPAAGSILGDGVRDPRHARPAGSGQFGPGMMVGSAVGCNTCTLRAEEHNLAGYTASPLGRVLLALGISHVVCVMPGREKRGMDSVARENEDPKFRWRPLNEGPKLEQRPLSEEPNLKPSGFLPDGSRLLRVTIPVREDAETAGKSGEYVSSPALPPARHLEDVLQFATGPRALFVGRQGGGGGAGALAVAWAMARTGKGVYETVLKFRQSCVGFWVSPSVLNSVAGRSS